MRRECLSRREFVLLLGHIQCSRVHLLSMLIKLDPPKIIYKSTHLISQTR